MKFADNLDRHKISDEFEKRKRIRHYLEHSLFNFYQIFMKLQINRTGIKYSTRSKLCHIALFILDLHALDCWYVGSQVSERCPLGYLFGVAVDNWIPLQQTLFMPYATTESRLACACVQSDQRPCYSPPPPPLDRIIHVPLDAKIQDSI